MSLTSCIYVRQRCDGNERAEANNMNGVYMREEHRERVSESESKKRGERWEKKDICGDESYLYYFPRICER